ncbi:MAG: discoidin domain-containing protein, partial [Pseudomonadales bacterium]
MLEKSYLVGRSFITAFLSFCLTIGASVNVHAYDVEADSVNNSIYILLRNLNPDDAYDSISVTNAAPGIVSAASATIIPASVAANGSDIAAVEFTVAAGASLGDTGELAITVTGTVAGQSVDVDIMVPLEVVANVATAQGFVGTGLPTPNASGVDSDGDGVSDALELAFGSDPNSADSQPGDPIVYIEENVPMLGFLGMLAMAVFFVVSGSAAARRNVGVLMLVAVTFLPMDLNAGSATRIHLIAEIPIPPPPPVQLTIASATASSQLMPASMAFDGNINTRWESTHGIDPQTLTVDLGATHLLSEVIIKWEAANASSYRIDGSLDGTNWTTGLASFSGGTWDPGAGVRRTDTLSVSGSYRYVRMYGLTRPAGNSYGYSIWEIDVYGNAIVDTDNDGVADSDDQCPSTPADSDVDADGCIIIDTDNDGVPDASDLCPSTPAGSFVDIGGCAINAVLISATASASSGTGIANLAVDGNMASR